MALPWLRLWADMPTDPKWRTIARESKQPLSVVICVYLHLMVSASNANERGRTQGTKSEDIASACDVETQAVDAVLQAMQGRVLEDDRLTGWDKRQPVREDGSAGRSKAWRDAKKAEKLAAKTVPNADRTQANAQKRPEEIQIQIEKGGRARAHECATPPPMSDKFREFIATQRPDLKHPDAVYQVFREKGKRTFAQWCKWVQEEHAGKEQPSTSMDPDSLAGVQAEAARKGMPAWNQLQEQFTTYRQRVRAAPEMGHAS